MKTRFATILVAIVTAFSTTTWAQPPTGQPDSGAIPPMVIPPTGKAGSGVSGWHGPQLMGNPAPAQVKITVQPALLPAQNTAGCWEVIGKAQEEYFAGVWRDATSYTIITNGIVRWQDLVYAEGIPTTWGVLQWVITVESQDGTDCISLTMLRVEATSTGGALYSVYLPNGGYSRVVYGVKTDGTPVTDGSPDQLVAKLVITVQMALFNGGATPEGLNQVKNHVEGWNDYTVRVEATMTCDTDTVGKAKVSTEGFPGATPRLRISKEAVLLESGDAERPYNIVRRPLADSGTWTNVAQVYVGDSIPATPGYYKVVLTP